MKENSYLYEKIRKIDNDELRPLFHFTAPVGWINDPNGLIYYKNYYQLYYQYNPYAPHWDNMHWGHARSKDGLHWEDMPIAMKPDHAYDKTGVFSGSAIEKTASYMSFIRGMLMKLVKLLKRNVWLSQTMELILRNMKTIR